MDVRKTRDVASSRPSSAYDRVVEGVGGTFATPRPVDRADRRSARSLSSDGQGLFYDPTGAKARAVKARYVGVCRGCGAYTQPRNGKGAARMRTANAAIPAPSNGSGRGSGCLRRWGSGSIGMAACRRPTTGRAWTQDGEGERRYAVSRRASGRRRAWSPPRSGAGRRRVRLSGRCCYNAQTGERDVHGSRAVGDEPGTGSVMHRVLLRSRVLPVLATLLSDHRRVRAAYVRARGRAWNPMPAAVASPGSNSAIPSSSSRPTSPAGGVARRRCYGRCLALSANPPEVLSATVGLSEPVRSGSADWRWL